DQLTGTLDPQLYPWLQTPPTEEPSHQAKASNVQKSAKPTASALTPLPNAGNAYSLRTTRATWATRPKTAANESVGSGGGGGVSGGGSAAAEGLDDLRRNGSRTVVFVMGGMTYSEIRAGYEIVKEYKRDVILGSTSIINSTQFINILKQIHVKDEKRGGGSVESLGSKSGLDGLPKSKQGSHENIASSSATPVVKDKEDAA
ncbi:hypothetical protein HDU98_006103, partial [Podochytrium sp. JEL0797]